MGAKRPLRLVSLYSIIFMWDKVGKFPKEIFECLHLSELDSLATVSVYRQAARPSSIFLPELRQLGYRIHMMQHVAIYTLLNINPLSLKCILCVQDLCYAWHNLADREYGILWNLTSRFSSRILDVSNIYRVEWH